MAVRIGHASGDENKKIKGGAAGDQTGKEVCVRDWYLHNKGWVVLRCKEAAKREKIAEAMEKACKNSQIGYDQNQRDSLFVNVKNSGFDPSKTTKNVETDCSALVRVCIAYAYGADKAGNIRTISEPDILVNTGLFTKYTSDKYCKSSDHLVRGDILCTPVSGHTVVVLDDGAAVKSTTTAATSTVTKTCSVIIKELTKGVKGETVKVLQTLLIANGYSCGDSGADGSFGSATLKAVEAYQKANKLTVDGLVGPKTWAKLLGM